MHVVNKSINTILLQVSGSMQEKMMVKENAEIVVSAQQLVYGFVKDVKYQNPKKIFLNGYLDMANIKIKHQDVTRAKTNRRQMKNACVRQT